MIVRGTWDWNLVKVETDSGVYGIGEAYWGPGVKDLILTQMKPLLLGEDPLNVDKLYTKMLMESAGAGALAGVTVTAASGIEIALWDLAGRILQTPACNLLGGRFRDRVRFYRTMPAVERPEDQQAWREQVLKSQLLAVQGTWQRDVDSGGEVRHLVATGFRDLTPLLGRLGQSSRSRDFH